MDHCDECGFDYGSVDPDEVPDRLAEAAGKVTGLLNGDERAVRRRPSADVWSPLEYACHLRDVFLVQRDRVVRGLVERTPEFTPMHRDERVDIDRYAEQEPRQVAEELRIAARLLGRTLAERNNVDWDRRVVYSWPEPTERDLRWVAAHTVHEAVHHIGDIEAGLAASA